MDIEELRVKLVASAEGFEEVTSKIKQQLAGLNKEIDRINEKIAGKRNNNNSTNDITPKINSNELESQLDDLTSKITSKTDEMVKKIESKTQGLMERLAEQANRLVDVISKGFGSMNIPTTKSKGESTSKTSEVTRTSSPRAPPINAEQLKSEIDSVTAVLDNFEEKINQEKAKLANLKIKIGESNEVKAIEERLAQIDNILKSVNIKERYNSSLIQEQIELQIKLNDLKARKISSSDSKAQNDILKTERNIVSLTAKADKLGFKLADLDAKLASVGEDASETTSKINNSSNATSRLESVSKKLKSVFDSINNSVGKSTNNLNRFSETAKKVGNNISNVANKTKGLFSGFKNIGSSTENCNKKMGDMNNGLNNIMKQFLTWMVILPIIMSGLSAMASGLLADLKTNEQFNTSLNQIKTNLMVAFTPVFYAILPAINALMSALATATTYIASFISSIFGKTYQQSYQATQGLIDAKKAMGAYGDSAKKAAKDALGLAGFDEINKLSKTDNGADDSKVPTLTQPSIDTSEVDSKMQALVDRLKEILGKIFDPMVEAWNKEGKNTLDAMKYALDSIWQLTKDIGSSFLDVWDNGTGVKVCTDILRLVQQIFTIIGDIATAFKTAWDNGNLGKQVVQTLFDALDSILKLLISIGETFRDVWNSGLGVEICTNILEILKNVFTIIGQIATSFRNAWNDGIGKQLVTDILNLLNGCLRVIKDITTSFSKAWETNGNTIAAGILLILDDIVGTISDIANKWANAWEDNGAGDTLVNSLLETLGKILTTIGDIGQGIRDSIGKASDTIFPAIIKFSTDVSTGLGDITDGFKTIWDNGGSHLFDGIVQLIAKVGELILKITGGAFKDFGNLFKDVLAPAIGTVADVLGDIVGWLADLVGKINENKPLLDGLETVFIGIGTALAGAKIAEFIAGIVTAFETLSTAITFVFSNGILAGLADIGGAIVVAVGGWPVLIAAAIVGIGVVIYSHLDEIKTKTMEIWNGIGDWLSTKWDNFTTWASEKFGSIKDTISTNWGEVDKDASEDWDDIGTTLSKKWDSILTTSSKTWDEFKKYIGDKWTEINNDAPGTWDTIKNTLKGKWDEISTTSQGVWNGIVSWINTTFSTDWSTAWNNIVNSFSTIWDGLKTAAKGPVNAVIGLMNGLIAGINTAIKALNDIDIDIPDWVPKIGGKSFSLHLKTISSIPALATGGIIDSPTLAMVGEAGKEAVMPLENNTGWITDLASKIAGIMGASSNSVSTTSDNGDIIFMLDGEVLGKVAIKQLQKMKRQGYDLSSLF